MEATQGTYLYILWSSPSCSNRAREELGYMMRCMQRTSAIFAMPPRVHKLYSSRVPPAPSPTHPRPCMHDGDNEDSAVVVPRADRLCLGKCVQWCTCGNEYSTETYVSYLCSYRFEYTNTTPARRACGVSAPSVATGRYRAVDAKRNLFIYLFFKSIVYCSIVVECLRKYVSKKLLAFRLKK